MSSSVSPSRTGRRTSRAGKGIRVVHRERPPRRTTITLSAESQEIVERFKNATGASASAAIDQIIRRSEPRAARLKSAHGFLVLDAPNGRPKVHATIEDIKRAEDEMDRESVERSRQYERLSVPGKAGKSRRR